MKRITWFLVSTLVGIAGLESAASARPNDQPRYGYGGRAAADRKIEVEWGSSWYPASIVGYQGDQTLIHYDGWSSAFDELVPDSRIRFADGVVDCEGQPQLVQIQWGGMWRAGRVMKVSGDQYLVHYDGWDSFFDEWVGKDKLAFATPPRDERPAFRGPPAVAYVPTIDYGNRGGDRGHGNRGRGHRGHGNGR
ncbi:MAG: hypothetical protein U1F43_05305 [Myxococcota bacterium]